VSTESLLKLGRELAWPLALMLLLLTLVETTSMDHWVTSLFYNPVSGSFPLNKTFLYKQVLHDWGRDLAYLSAVLVLAGLAYSWYAKLPSWRPPLGFIFLSLLLSTGTIALIKYSSSIHCPIDLLEYGGQFQPEDLLSFTHIQQAAGRCWPSGHASTGFCFLGFFYAARVYRPHWAKPILIFAVTLGVVFSMDQTARGLHFFSHGLWTALIIWTINVLLAATMRRQPI
jgi:membrane-associated PAP2 superfamily phosphatase